MPGTPGTPAAVVAPKPLEKQLETIETTPEVEKREMKEKLLASLLQEDGLR